MKFRISSALKNIIGKDLIVDDYIAIFELVKNAFDAHASHVDITFTPSSVIIQDNGKGMSKDDLEDKWLFVAYSAKELGIEDDEFFENKHYASKEFDDYRNKIQNHRVYAGAKGIGRFSCDRLGSQLRLITRKIGESQYHQLDVNWDKFEEDAEQEFIDIEVDYTIPTEKTLARFNNFDHGTILEILFLRDIWERDHKLELKHSLGKLINPFENSSISSFQIQINDREEKSTDLEKSLDRDKINGFVQNSILDILNIKTTSLEIRIHKDKIISELIDRGELIYKIEEPNPYSLLENIHFRLFFLNRAAKANFTRQMDIRPINFGSIFLYNNGFRVYPFGNEGDDSLKIDQRHTQAYARTLGLRDLLGSIEILQKSEQFRETSSRDGGLIKSDGTLQLFEAFMELGLKRLEKYVVSIQWAYQDDYKLEGDKDRDDIFLLNTLVSKQKIIDLIARLVDKDTTTLLEYNRDFLNIVNDKMAHNSPEILKNLKKLAIETNDQNLLDEIAQINHKVIDLQQSLIQAQKDVQNAFENEEKAIMRAEKSEQFAQKALQEKQIIEQVKQKQDEQLLFLKAIQPLDKEQLINFQHHIGLYAYTIQDTITSFRKALNKEEMLTKEEINNYLKSISLNTQKILAINKYATKANFLSSAQTINANLVTFIEEYINNVYSSTTSNSLNIKLSGTQNRFIKKFKPMEMTIIIDNLLSNSRKAKAKNILIDFQKDEENLVLIYTDDGQGLDKSIANKNDIFNIGFTTTRGSGLGLHHIQELITSLKGSIEIGSRIDGIEFIIRLKNDTGL